MNLINATVTRILTEPYSRYGKHFVKVEYIAYGRYSTTELMFSCLAEAEEVKVGYEFNT